MSRALAAFVAGVLFTLGLNLSGMTLPDKILGFLDFTDLYTGAWDPSLIVVMTTALLVHAILYRMIIRRPRPVLADRFFIPPAGRVDAPLVVGSLVWGAGWGLTGLCPGPILAAVGDLNQPGVVFFAAMLLGMWLHKIAGIGGARTTDDLATSDAPALGQGRTETFEGAG